MQIVIGEWEKRIEQKIKTRVNHFRQKPLNYFTEPDIHSYRYLIFYWDKGFSRQFSTANPRQRTILVHREYPTFFKFKKDIPVKLGKTAVKRGHYDLVVLNPEFVNDHCFEVVTNKDYSLMLNRLKTENKIMKQHKRFNQMIPPTLPNEIS